MISAVVKGIGIYLGPWEAAPGHPVHVYVDDDFLRDQAGKPLTLSFNEAVIELARRNQVWAAGNGTEAALRTEIAKGRKEFEGKLIIPPRELLHGYDEQGNHTHPEGNIYALVNAGKLPKIAATVKTW